MNYDPTPSANIEKTTEERQRLGGEMGRVVVFRVMSLEGRSDIETVSGNSEYTVKNPNYPDEGDYVFQGKNALDKAGTFAYPHKLGQLYAIRAALEDIMTPHPEDAPHVAYIKNGAQVEAVKLPEEYIDRFLKDPDDPQLQDEVAEDLFGPNPSQTSEK